MALSDSFRKVAVYFGLAEDREYYDDDEPDAREPERELESRYQERPNVRRLQSRRRRDEIDDIFGDDSSSERTAQLRPVGGRLLHVLDPRRLLERAQATVERSMSGSVSIPGGAS